jgi:uncharacterized protein YfdQ (DUF2303 family)
MTMADKTDLSAVPAELISPAPFIPPDLKALRDLTDDAGTEIVHINLDEPLPGLPNNIPALLDRKAGRVLGVSELFEKYRTRPALKSGTAHVTAIESFIDLVNRHKTDDSVIFADTDWTEPSLLAVIDYHEAKASGSADWLKHRIVYDFPLTDEWKAWIACDGRVMEQEDFAEWFEEHLPELSAPDSQESEDFLANYGLKVAYPNEILALTRGISVHVESRVKNNITLQSGEGEITFEEEHKDAKTGVKLAVPGLFILSIKPFKMGSACRIPVRLRYRVAGGAVKWLFKMLRPEEYITQEILRDCERAASETELPLYHGAPEA